MKQSANKEQSQTPTSEEDIRVLLKMTNWDDYTTKVIKVVAEKAQRYKEARARSLEGSSRQVFI